MPRLATLARLLAWGISALYMLCLLVFTVSIIDLAQFPATLTTAALGLALVAARLTAGMVACTVLVWRRGYWSVIGRAHYTLLTLGALALAFWKRSIWYGAALINGMVLFKIGWTFVCAEAEGALLHLLPAVLGLAICNIVLFAVLRWAQRRVVLGSPQLRS